MGSEPGETAEPPKEPRLRPNCGHGHWGCCASMIMSPFVLVRNVPLIGPPRGGQIEADSDEPQGVGTGASAGAGARQTVAGRGCRSTATRELPAGEAAVEAVSGRRGRRAAAPQR